MNKGKFKSFQSRKDFNSDYSKPDQDCSRRRQEGRKVASTAITTTFITTVVNANGQPQVQLVKPRPFITLPTYVRQKKKQKQNSMAVSREKENRSIKAGRLHWR